VVKERREPIERPMTNVKLEEILHWRVATFASMLKTVNMCFSYWYSRCGNTSRMLREVSYSTWSLVTPEQQEIKKKFQSDLTIFRLTLSTLHYGVCPSKSRHL